VRPDELLLLGDPPDYPRRGDSARRRSPYRGRERLSSERSRTYGLVVCCYLLCVAGHSRFANDQERPLGDVHSGFLFAPILADRSANAAEAASRVGTPGRSELPAETQLEKSASHHAASVNPVPHQQVGRDGVCHHRDAGPDHEDSEVLQPFERGSPSGANRAAPARCNRTLEWGIVTKTALGCWAGAQIRLSGIAVGGLLARFVAMFKVLNVLKGGRSAAHVRCFSPTDALTWRPRLEDARGEIATASSWSA
jgi:hypothetical protein